MAPSKLKRNLIAVSVFVLGLLGGWWFLANRTPALSSENARDMATKFLADIRSGRVDGAWETTAADFKSMWGRDRFRSYVKSKPLFKAAADFEACEFKTDGDLRLAECVFRPSTGKGRIKVVLCLDQRLWKVGRLTVE